MVIIVQKLKLEREATKVEVNDMRYASCLTLAPSALDATLGGSGGITPDPNLETGQEEAKALEERRQRFGWIQRTGMQIERDLKEKAAVIMLLQKIRSYEEGEGEGRVLDTEKIPKLREKWGQLYKWMFELMK